MKFLKKHSLSITLIFIGFILTWQGVTNPLWKEEKVIRSDAIIYYTYLPATFIDNNPLFDPDKGDESNYQVHKSPIGKNAVKMSMGVAVLNVPFFLAGHCYANIDANYEANGFSAPYHLAILLSSVFYTLFGLIFLGLFLKRKFSKVVAIITIILIGFGTNLYYYAVYEGGMSHPIVFFLLSLLLFVTNNWINNKKIWKSLLIGLIFGLIILIRPINILFCIPFLFFLEQPNQSRKKHFKNLFLPIHHIILIVVGVMLAVSPQLYFWKVQTGEWIYYSYREEGFFWTNPHIWKGLFSFRKGWFIYTPMMLIACFGFYHLYKSRRNYFWGIITFLIPFLYVTFSWWCWWYGGSFGARTLIDILPFMSIPLAALVEKMLVQRYGNLLMMVFCLLIYLNLFQSWQYSKGFIHYDGMTKSAYKKIFLKDYTTNEYWELILRPDYENALANGVELEGIPIFSRDKNSPIYEESIQNFINYIKSDEAWMEDIKKKAIMDNISIDSALRVVAEDNIAN